MRFHEFIQALPWECHQPKPQRPRSTWTTLLWSQGPEAERWDLKPQSDESPLSPSWNRRMKSHDFQNVNAAIHGAQPRWIIDRSRAEPTIPGWASQSSLLEAPVAAWRRPDLDLLLFLVAAFVLRFDLQQDRLEFRSGGPHVFTVEPWPWIPPSFWPRLDVKKPQLVAAFSWPHIDKHFLKVGERLEKDH